MLKPNTSLPLALIFVASCATAPFAPPAPTEFPSRTCGPEGSLLQLPNPRYSTLPNTGMTTVIFEGDSASVGKPDSILSAEIDGETIIVENLHNMDPGKWHNATKYEGKNRISIGKLSLQIGDSFKRQKVKVCFERTGGTRWFMRK